MTLRVDDDRIDPGETIRVTGIAQDDTGLDWIQFEGRRDDNNNDNIEDPALARQEFDCDNQRQCANVFTLTPTVSGEYRLRARARDIDGNRSEWTTVSLRIRDGAANTPPAACSPRPPVAVTVAPGAPGSLQATIAVNGTGNAIQQVRFDPQNAIVRTNILPEQSGPFVLTPQNGTQSLTFTSLRRSPGAVMVRLVVVDACGEWPTFVGAGA